MGTVHRLSRQDARRAAVRAQLLERDRPSGLIPLVRRLTRLLDFMSQRGEVAVAGRRGRDRLWDLAERVYPGGPHPDVPGALREPGYLDGSAFGGRAALLSPFDRLVHDRVRAEEIFDFTYQLEMYKPPAKRRWGYYALPVLFGDELVGKLDAKADRKDGVLVVNAIHADVPFTAEMTAAVDEEITSLAAWLGLDVRRAPGQ